MSRRSLLLVLLLAAAQAQTPAAPTYDVSTIRPTNPNRAIGNTDVDIDNTVLRTSGTTPRVLLQIAFDTPRDLIFNLPKWADTARYDLQAKDSTTDPVILRHLSRAESHRMVQQLLSERFGLRWHTEDREVSVYELVYLHPAAGLQPAKAELQDTSTHNRHLIGKGISLDRLARRLGDELGRPVLDRTDRKGFYDVDLRWRPDNEAAAATAANDPDAPPILFTALEEQLGLKLRSSKQTVPVLVIDRISPPTPN